MGNLIEKIRSYTCSSEQLRDIQSDINAMRVQISIVWATPTMHAGTVRVGVLRCSLFVGARDDPMFTPLFSARSRLRSRQAVPTSHPGTRAFHPDSTSTIEDQRALSSKTRVLLSGTWLPPSVLYATRA
jgi:hypothetical protein